MNEQAWMERMAGELAGWDVAGRRVLLVVPDRTRTCPLAAAFHVAHRVLGATAARVDVMVALGTHPPLPEAELLEHLGITPEERRGAMRDVALLNHAWDDPARLVSIGDIGEDEVAVISGGLFRQALNVQVNRAVMEYDLLVVIGPVFPHEVAGYSGGNKYFFPGISGPEVLNFFHWLGAVITNPRIIGAKYTPVRAVIDRAASLIPAERRAVCLVVKGTEVAGVYAGEVEEAWSRAADHSATVHVERTPRLYHTVVSCCPPMYDELWTAGKCMYKVEPAVADGGRVLIYAPHLDEVSVAHGRTLFEIGYHVRDYFTAQWDRFKGQPWGVLAHSTHVKGIGTYEGGVERPRVEVVLASRIGPDACHRLNLGYLDPSTLDLDDYRGREDEGILVVPKAGEILYRGHHAPPELGGEDFREKST
jgi:nickel-dependent lactate racemase